VDNQRIAHDVAVAAADDCLGQVAEFIDPARHDALWGEFYITVKAAITTFDLLRERQEHRLHPTKN
jgi:hypothetical protein